VREALRLFWDMMHALCPIIYLYTYMMTHQIRASARIRGHTLPRCHVTARRGYPHRHTSEKLLYNTGFYGNDGFIPRTHEVQTMYTIGLTFIRHGNYFTLADTWTPPNQHNPQYKEP